MLLASPAPLALSRWQEHEADRFGLEITQNSPAAARAFVRLHDENLAVPRTGLLFKLWRGSHPDLADRIDFANRYRPWARGERLRYGRRFRSPTGSVGSLRSAVQIDDTLFPGRRALLALQIGAVLVVLAALPYPLFQLDRYTFVKELVLLAAALAAVLSCLAAARGLTVFMADALISGFLALSLISALFADNPWLAFRACGVSLAGAALFWSARSVTLAGHGQRLLTALAVSVVIGSSTGLVQAYGLVTSELASTDPRAGRHLRQPELHGAHGRRSVCRCWSW